MSETRGNNVVNQASSETSGFSTLNSESPASTAKSKTSPNSPATSTRLNRQIDFFAEQNEKSATKKAKNAKALKKILLIGGPILGVIVIGLIVWLVLSLVNKPRELELEDIDNLRFTFGEIYDQNQNLDDVRDRYNQVLDSSIGREHVDQVKLQMLYFYMSNGYAARAVELGETMDINKLSTEAKTAYYSQMYNAYLNVDNPTKALEMQFESAMLKGELEDDQDSDGDNKAPSSNDQNNDQNGDQGNNQDGNQNDNSSDDKNNNQSGSDGGKGYTCDGVTYDFPVECAENGVEPDVF